MGAWAEGGHGCSTPPKQLLICAMCWDANKQFFFFLSILLFLSLKVPNADPHFTCEKTKAQNGDKTDLTSHSKMVASNPPGEECPPYAAGHIQVCSMPLPSRARPRGK